MRQISINMAPKRDAVVVLSVPGWSGGAGIIIRPHIGSCATTERRGYPGWPPLSICRSASVKAVAWAWPISLLFRFICETQASRLAFIFLDGTPPSRRVIFRLMWIASQTRGEGLKPNISKWRGAVGSSHQSEMKSGRQLFVFTH